MALLTVEMVSRSGVDVAGVAAASGGDEFTNSGSEFVEIKNGGASSINVTFETQATVDGEAVADKVVAIPAGVTKIIGPFPRGVYNDVNGRVKISYSAVTSVTVKVLKLKCVAE